MRPVVGLNDGDRLCEFVVLNELDGDRNLVIQIGRAEEMLDDSGKRQEDDSAEAVLMRRALTARPMTITKAEP